MFLVEKKWSVKLLLLEDMLGTVPKDRKVFSSYLKQKAREKMEKDGTQGKPLADGQEATATAIAERLDVEEETLAEVEERGWTGFFTDAEGPYLLDYMVRGFLKESARAVKQWPPVGLGAAEDEEEEEDEAEDKEAKPKKKAAKKGLPIKQLQDRFSRYLFVTPRRLRLPKVGEEDVLERPLRAITMQGPRVTVVRSDIVKAGAVIDFQLSLIRGSGLSEECIRGVMEYGLFQGLGQWRSGGFGRFQIESMTLIK